MSGPQSAPRLSICLVVRNGRAGLERSLRSLDGQQRPLQRLGAELVIVDGESSDGSAERAHAFARRMADVLEVRVLSQPPRGIYAAMNHAWQQARGEWLLYLNAGDLLLDASVLADAVEVAETAAAGVAATMPVDSVQCQMALFHPGRRWAVWRPGRIVAAHQALIYRRVLHQRLGGYDERLQICADTLLMQAIGREPQLRWPRLLAATDVSPADASRDPSRIRRDLAVLAAEGIPLRPWPRPRLTLAALRLERHLGVSLTVWLRLLLAWLRGEARVVPLD